MAGESGGAPTEVAPEQFFAVDIAPDASPRSSPLPISSHPARGFFDAA